MATIEAARHAQAQAQVEYGDHPNVRDIWTAKFGVDGWHVVMDVTEAFDDLPTHILDVDVVVNVVGDAHAL